MTHKIVKRSIFFFSYLAAAKLPNTPPTSIPSYNIKLGSKPVVPPPQQPPPSKNQSILISKYFWFIDPIKPNLNAARPQATKIDFSTLVQEQAGMSDFGSKARQGTAAIGDIRKAELAKELDPTVLKACSHTSLSSNPIKTKHRFENGQKEKNEIFVHYYVHYPM